MIKGFVVGDRHIYGDAETRLRWEKMYPGRQRWNPYHNTASWQTCPCEYCIAERLRKPIWQKIMFLREKYKERFGQNPPYPLCDELVKKVLEDEENIS